MELNLTTLLFEIVNFVVLVWILERFTRVLSDLSPAEDDPTVTERELIRLAGHGALRGRGA